MDLRQLRREGREGPAHMLLRNVSYQIQPHTSQAQNFMIRVQVSGSNGSILPTIANYYADIEGNGSPRGRDLARPMVAPLRRLGTPGDCS